MSRVAVHVTGVALFLFVPTVLFLLLRPPEPIAVSLAAALALIALHRVLAGAYSRRVVDRRCVWCTRVDPVQRVVVATTAEAPSLVVCADHEPPTRRTLAFLGRNRLILRSAVLLPLLALVVALAMVAAGRRWEIVEPVRAIFMVTVGLATNLAALGPFLGSTDDPLVNVIPPHNLPLIGLRQLMWLFRLVGLVWVVRGGADLLKLLGVGLG